MNTNRRIHDGIVGAVLIAGVLMAQNVNPVWWWLPGILGVALLQSAFTGFCPVYFVIEKMTRKPAQSA